MATPVKTGEQAPRPAPSAQRALAQLRRTVDTAPGRLRMASAVLAVLVVAFGALTAWQVSGRAHAADQVVSHSQPLSQDAAEIYRSLADADTTAASGFLLAGDAPQALRDRYENDLATAARLLAQAAARTDAASDAQQWVAALNQQLPQYAGLVETARVNNRQGLPLGGAYLRYASHQMQDTMLPAAQRLVDAEARQLDGDYAEARSFPWAAIGLGVLALAALLWCQVQLLRRTNRVFNAGLVGATAAVLAAVLWLLASSLSARVDLADSRLHGAGPLRSLNAARIEALQSRAAENLDLVARGATDGYSKRWTAVTEMLSGPPAANGRSWARGSTLAQARQDAPRDADSALAQAQTLFTAWDSRHRAAATSNDGGDYEAALKTVIGTSGGSGTDTSDQAFNAMDQQLARAAVIEQAAFKASAQGVGGSLDTLAAGAGLLAVLAAVGVVVGLGRRLAEYR
ncbi:hypothetical protein FB465_5120 [Kitasatospora atroaurantiaca]|uniref:Secreted protein n=1 Tax=Kitasatospora atroaurantiaca TaxID=285545 RepID=A0A561EWJ3_9ACTN|nr:hypothetical protein FB465_5120 [Kitasatospora atroaurantiaca]